MQCERFLVQESDTFSKFLQQKTYRQYKSFIHIIEKKYFQCKKRTVGTRNA